MDTDDLSQEAYQAIIIEAERFTHDLTLHYGLLSYDCKNETEYLAKAEELTKEILKCDDIDLDDLFWGEPPEKKELHRCLKKILVNIEKVKAITIEKRKFDFYQS